MINLVPDVLNASELTRVRRGLQEASFVPGASTAGGAAREVKRNLQVAMNCPAYQPIADLVRAAFLRNDALRNATLPAAITVTMFNRYTDGGSYGAHMDSPLMGAVGALLRTDMAMTLFVSDPASYDGGELTIARGDGSERTVKGAAGSAVVYPANTLHRVTPVTRGTRDAAILWIQSLIREPARRDLLWDLDQAQREIYAKQGKCRAFETVNRAHKNLLRMWSQV